MHSRDWVLSEIRFQTYSQFQCSKVPPESAFFQTIYQGCIWKPEYANKILCLKSRRASLYTDKALKISRLPIDRLLFFGRFTGRFVVGNRLHKSSVLTHTGHWERTTPMRLKLVAFFNCTYLFTWWCLKFFSAPDRNRTNVPIIIAVHSSLLTPVFVQEASPCLHRCNQSGFSIDQAT